MNALYPTWLLSTPQRLAVHHGQPHYQGAFTLLAGLQRIEAGWLERDAHCALRDYFVASRGPRHRQTGICMACLPECPA